MNKSTKTIIFALLLLVIPTKVWAQDYRDYESGFLFNVFGIENVEERIQLASALATSDIWLCNPTENPGELYIRPNSFNADIPIYAEFDYLRQTLREEYEEALSLSKEEFNEIIESWAHNISHDYYNFLISDHLDRANHCMDAEPFCTSDTYDFPALNSGYSWSGPDYGCLGSSPTNKHSFWYYMRIGVAGNITILIEASFDVDFALWGPFDNQTDPCPLEEGETGLLTAGCDDCPNNTSSTANYPYGNLHDCSFDARHYEYAHVVNGQVGQYFILLITNYSGSSGNITFQKYAGDGETDCGIMPGIVSNTGPYCEGETIQLNVNEQPNATYTWTGPDGWTSTLQNPTRPNCTMNMAGEYSCTTTVGTQNTTASTVVEIYQQAIPSFTASTECQGSPTVFNAQASGSNVTRYEWDFGDGEIGDGQNANHTYAQAGTYQVTLTVSAEDGSCPAELTQTVVVDAMPDAGDDELITIAYGTSAQLSGSGGNGNFTYYWEPANMVTNPNAQNTQTIVLTQSQVYTLTITNPAHPECTDSKQVSVLIEGGALAATISAESDEFCLGNSTQITVTALYGTGNYTYSWAHDPSLNSATITVAPTTTTTYTCTVRDGQTEWIVNQQIIVNFPETRPSVPLTDSCNMARIRWTDGQGNEQTYTFLENGSHTFEGLTENGCHLEQTYYFEGMQYTPQPEIVSADPNVEWPHYPITATEFNVNLYTYTVRDLVSDIAGWNNSQCAWYIDKDTWRIDPSDDNLSCTVYAMDWREDTIWLTFKAVNECSGSEGVMARYWLKPSFYGIGEQDSYLPSIDILPNPNDGQMELRVENMEGRIQTKVCNTSGMVVDEFEIPAHHDTYSYYYTMKRLSNGVYYFVFSDGKRSITKKVVIIQ